MNKARYELEKYVPIPLCNTFSMHTLKSYDIDQNLLEKSQVFITDTNGILFLIDDGDIENRSWDLKEHLDEETLEDFSLELVCSDLSNFGFDNDKNLFTYIASCWVFYDDLFRPQRYMLVFFRFNKDFTFERLLKEDIVFAPTCTRMRLLNNQLYWLIFGHNSTIQCYQCNFNEKEQSNKVIQLANFVETFPALRPSSIFGSMTRIDQLTMENFQFELMGFDSGYLVASVCSTQDNVLLDRKLIKYNTPISIAMFVNLGIVEQDICVLISSTIGPAALWMLKFDHETRKLSWQVKCQLLESDKSDCVMCGSLHTGDLILIGTYTEQLLFYSIKDAVCFSEIGPINQLNVGAPILSISTSDESLLVLSTKGLQRFNCSLDDDSENILPFSNSSSPTQNLTND